MNRLELISFITVWLLNTVLFVFGIIRNTKESIAWLQIFQARITTGKKSALLEQSYERVFVAWFCCVVSIGVFIALTIWLINFSTIWPNL